jgi:hypothetical protein
VYTGQCPVLQEDTALELGSLGNSQRLLRYNSPDMSSVHRTVRCASGATTTSRQRSPADAFNARQKRAEVRHARADAPDTLQCMSGAPPDIQAGPAVRAPTVGTQRPGDVAGAPDSVRCTPDCPVRPSPTAFSNGYILVGGYKYHPNRPLQSVGVQATFQVI